MPGPNNGRKRKNKKKEVKVGLASPTEAFPTLEDASNGLAKPPVDSTTSFASRPESEPKHEPVEPSWFLSARGDRRVREVKEFLQSSWSVPPTVSDPFCGQMYGSFPVLCKILPEELAMIVEYNTSRKAARICPVCRRFYNLEDILPPHLDDYSDAAHDGPHTEREKMMSGLCSFICFGTAAYRFPGSIGAWGVYADEMDPATHQLLQGDGIGADFEDEGLGLMLKLTRSRDVKILDLLEEVEAGATLA